MPHLHKDTDHTLRLAAGLWPITSGELLADTIFYAGCDKNMMSGSFVLLIIV